MDTFMYYLIHMKFSLSVIWLYCILHWACNGAHITRYSFAHYILQTREKHKQKIDVLTGNI